MQLKKRFSNAIAQIYIICVYVPICIQLLWLCLEYKRKPTILWKTNPLFPYGGMICGKSLIFQKFQQKKENDAFLAKTLLIPRYDTIPEKIKQSETFIQKHRLHYPLILKPDDGIGGIGLHFIKDKKALHKTLTTLKKNYILQEYVPWPSELSVFFIRDPHQKNWKIWAITRRYTIKKEQDPELMIPERKIICKDESHLITPALNRIFNTISNVQWFYFGRFDVRVKDIDTFLSQGKDFTILEVNVGAHSIALHAFDTKYNRSQRYKIFFDQLKFAFEIANKNRAIPSCYPKQTVNKFLKEFMDIYKNT